LRGVALEGSDEAQSDGRRLDEPSTTSILRPTMDAIFQIALERSIELANIS
jgi:hypothetical protein